MELMILNPPPSRTQILFRFFFLPFIHLSFLSPHPSSCLVYRIFQHFLASFSSKRISLRRIRIYLALWRPVSKKHPPSRFWELPLRHLLGSRAILPTLTTGSVCHQMRPSDSRMSETRVGMAIWRSLNISFYMNSDGMLSSSSSPFVTVSLKLG